MVKYDIKQILLGKQINFIKKSYEVTLICSNLINHSNFIFVNDLYFF